MKKIILFIIMFLGITNVYAKDSITNMNIDIYIDENGNAKITEIWDASLSGSNSYTEGYKQYFNLGNSEIRDYTVSMNGQMFTTLDSWDVDGSFNDKAYKAGINHTSSGDEICFGITEYGNNQYKLEYTITNFVNKTDDSEIVYWAIVPEEFGFPVDNIYVKAYSDFDYSDSLDVWGYGYDGYAYVYDGYIEMSTEHGLNENEYMVLLIKFPKGTFNTASTIDNDFNYYYDLAQQGASPNKPSVWSNILTVIMSIISFIFTFGIWIIIFVSAARSSNKVGSKNFDYSLAPKKLPKNNDINYFRDIPCNKDIFRAYWVANNYGLMKNKTDFLGSLLLKWINENKIEITSVTSKVLKKESKAVVFKEGITFENSKEEQLYNWMKTASGDNILEKDEFKKYCNRHYSKILKWFDEIMDYETNRLVKSKEVTIGEKKTLGFTSKKYIISPKMRDEAIELKGLKNFLNDFSNIKDKSAIEVKLLNEYLMFAQLFGIASKVAKEFKRLYPDVISDMTYDNIIFINYVSTTGVSAATTAKSRAESYSAGGGGFSSSGGGGGSFGGGGGGGFR